MKSELNNIHGIDLKINELEFIPYFMGDIMEFDGPILSHYVDQRQKNYLLYTLDYEGTTGFSIWLLFKISVTNLSDYLNLKVTLLELINISSNQIGYLVWCDKKGNHRKYKIINISHIPEKFLPTKESFFDKDFQTSYFDELKRNLSNSISKKKSFIKADWHLGAKSLQEDKFVYHSVYSDLNVFKSRLISHLLEPTIKYSEASHIDQDLIRVIHLVDFVNIMEQDPFGTVYTDLLKYTSKLLNIEIANKPSDKQYDEIVYKLTKMMADSIINKHAPKKNKIFAQAYIVFIHAIDDASIEMKYVDIRNEEKFKKIQAEINDTTQI